MSFVFGTNVFYLNGKTLLFQFSTLPNFYPDEILSSLPRCVMGFPFIHTVFKIVYLGKTSSPRLTAWPQNSGALQVQTSNSSFL